MRLISVSVILFGMVSGHIVEPIVPHLSGIFLRINPNTAKWSREEWATDLRSMQAVGIHFVCLHVVALGTNVSSSQCPYGKYSTYFPTSGLPSPCFTAAAGAAGSALLTILEAMEEVGGMTISLGLAEPKDRYFVLSGPGWGAYSQLQQIVAAAAWNSTSYSQRQHITGIYTVIEPHNGRSPWVSLQSALAGYFQSLAVFVKSTLRSDLVVWNSPYAAGNYTEDKKQGGIMSPAEYGAWWSKTFSLAPAFDTIAMQDHRVSHSFHLLSQCIKVVPSFKWNL
jgi:hypothetical protein